MASNSHRMVIIGLDSMPYGLIKALAKSGVMPNTRAIIENCVFRQMQSSIPEISSVAWSSIITGTNPGQHGIFGFTDVPDGTYRLSFFKVKVVDSGTGFRALKRELASKLNLKGKCTCGILVLEANRHGARIVEVPITLHHTLNKRNIAWSHFWQIFYVLPWLFR